ncbi:MAG: branched-chain amino acid ABC transporter permease [Candidatus Peregrinibacteria bacterium]
MDYIFHLLIAISIYGILAVSLNYVAGYTGILSLSHATFYGIGAYATAILTQSHGFGFISSLLIGVAATAIIAWLASYPLLKMKGDAFLLVSLGFAIIMYNVMLNWDGLTHGPLGIKGVMAPTIFGISFSSKPAFFALILGALALTYLFFQFIVRSPYGTIIKGIRENPTVTSVNGHPVLGYQRSVFVLGAIFAAIAGSFAATFFQFIEPKLFNLMPYSVLILIMVILGGLGNMKGAIIGAAILILVPEFLRFAGFPHAIIGELQQIVYGCILVTLMYFRPEGLFGEYKI